MTKTEKPISRELAEKQIEIILKISPMVNSLSELYSEPEKCTKEIIFDLISTSSTVADELIMSIAQVYPDLDPHVNNEEYSD